MDTWLDRLAIDARVVMGVAREALPVTVPSVDTPAETETD